MYNTRNNENISNRMTDFLHRNIRHEGMMSEEKFFGTPANADKGDPLESNEEVTPDFYNRAVNGDIPENPLSAVVVGISNRKLGSGMEATPRSEERKLGSGETGGEYNGQSEELFGSGETGGAKNSYIEHVKAYQKKHGVSYKQAMKDSRASYTKKAPAKKVKKTKAPAKAKLVPAKDLPLKSEEKYVKPLPVKTQMRGTDLMGGKMSKTQSKPSSWIEHIKNYAKEHNISYKEAMTKGKASYKK